MSVYLFQCRVISAEPQDPESPIPQELCSLLDLLTPELTRPSVLRALESKKLSQLLVIIAHLHPQPEAYLIDPLVLELLRGGGKKLPVQLPDLLSELARGLAMLGWRERGVWEGIAAAAKGILMGAPGGVGRLREGPAPAANQFWQQGQGATGGDGGGGGGGARGRSFDGATAAAHVDSQPPVGGAAAATAAGDGFGSYHDAGQLPSVSWSAAAADGDVDDGAAWVPDNEDEWEAGEVGGDIREEEAWLEAPSFDDSDWSSSSYQGASSSSRATESGSSSISGFESSSGASSRSSSINSIRSSSSLLQGVPPPAPAMVAATVAYSPALTPFLVVDLCHLAVALSDVGYYDAELMDLLAAAAVTKVRLMSPQQVSELIGAFAQLGHVNQGLLQAVVERLDGLVLRPQRPQERLQQVVWGQQQWQDALDWQGEGGAGKWEGKGATGAAAGAAAGEGLTGRRGVAAGPGTAVGGNLGALAAAVYSLAVLGAEQRKLLEALGRLVVESGVKINRQEAVDLLVACATAGVRVQRGLGKKLGYAVEAVGLEGWHEGEIEEVARGVAVIGGKEEWGRRVLVVVGAAAVAHAEGCSLGELVGVLWGCVKFGLKQEYLLAEVVVARALSGAGNLSITADSMGEEGGNTGENLTLQQHAELVWCLGEMGRQDLADQVLAAANASVITSGAAAMTIGADTDGSY